MARSRPHRNPKTTTERNTRPENNKNNEGKMATTERKLVTTEQTVSILDACLGDLAKWHSRLMEFRRTTRPGLSPAHLHGLRLEPFGKVGASPRYCPHRVVEFIRAVRDTDPAARSTAPALPHIEAESFVFDDSPLLPWQWRKLHPVVARPARRCRHLKPAPTDDLITVGEK